MGRPLSTTPPIAKDARLKDLSRRLGECARTLRKISDEAQHEPISVEALEQVSRDIFKCAHSVNLQSSRVLAQRRRTALAHASSSYEPPTPSTPDEEDPLPNGSLLENISEFEAVARWTRASSPWIRRPPSLGPSFTQQALRRDRLRRNRDEAEDDRRFINDSFMRRRFTPPTRFSRQSPSAVTRRQFVEMARAREANLRRSSADAELDPRDTRLNTRDAPRAIRSTLRRIEAGEEPTLAQPQNPWTSSERRESEDSLLRDRISPGSPYSEAPVVQTPPTASTTSTP